MALATSEPSKFSVFMTDERVANDTLKGSDGKPLRNIIYTWQVTDEVSGTQFQGAHIYTGATAAADLNTGAGAIAYVNLAAGSTAVGPGGLYRKTSAAGTATGWVKATEA